MKTIWNFIKQIWNAIKNLYNIVRKYLLKRIVKKINKLLDTVETEVMDEILELLLRSIRLFLCLDSDYHKNIIDFDARYTLRSERGRIAASAIFKKGKMKVKGKEIDNTNVEVYFKDGKVMWDFLMSPNPDIFAFVLDNKLRYEGNLNYLMKFAYMAKRLKSMFGL